MNTITVECSPQSQAHAAYQRAHFILEDVCQSVVLNPDHPVEGRAVQRLMHPANPARKVTLLCLKHTGAHWCYKKASEASELTLHVWFTCMKQETQSNSTPIRKLPVIVLWNVGECGLDGDTVQRIGNNKQYILLNTNESFIDCNDSSTHIYSA